MFRNSCTNKITIFNSNRQNFKQLLENTKFGQLSICRGFLGIPSLPNLPPQKKEYIGRKLVGFSMYQMYTVVSDVGNYKNFVPFCKQSLIKTERPGFLEADLIVGFSPIVESYRSKVTLVKPNLVRAICKDGKLFNHLETTWRFSPALKSNPQSCIVDFYVSFEFRSMLHSHLAHIFFEKLVRQMEGAFINEARVRYGKESVKSTTLDVR